MSVRCMPCIATVVTAAGLAANSWIEKEKKNRFEEIQKLVTESLLAIQKAEKTYEKADKDTQMAFDSYIQSINTHRSFWDFINPNEKKPIKEAFEFYEERKKYNDEEQSALYKARVDFKEKLLTPEGRFSEILEAMNSLKGKGAPIAVILRAEEDHNGAGSRVHVFAGILTIALTHRIFFEIISSSQQIPEVLQKANESASKPVDLLVILAHGCDTEMQFGKDGVENAIYEMSNIDKKDFSSMNPSGRIILDSCLVGNALAPQLAAITGLEVIAPIASIAKDVVRFHQSQDGSVIAKCTQFTKDYPKEEQIFRIFRAGKKPKDPSL